jgi:hypothetical protein
MGRLNLAYQTLIFPQDGIWNAFQFLEENRQGGNLWMLKIAIVVYYRWTSILNMPSTPQVDLNLKPTERVKLGAVYSQ